MPSTSTATEALFVSKILAIVLGATFATTMVMFMTQPRSRNEWICAMMSTVLCSIGLGAYVVTHYTDALHLPELFAAQIIGFIYFVCGLPGWFLVRMVFYTIKRFEGKDAVSIVRDIRGQDDDVA